MIVFDDKEAGAKIMEEVHGCFNPNTDRVIANYRETKLLGGVVYQKYAGKSCHGHFAGFDPFWLSRDMLWVGFHYPFVQLGCNVLLAQVNSLNAKALNLDLKLGFKQQIVLPDVFPDGGDLVVLTMTRADCRWLNLAPRTIQAGH